MKCKLLMSALLQMTIETDETTDKVRAPIVPNWNLLFSLILPSSPFDLTLNNA